MNIQEWKDIGFDQTTLKHRELVQEIIKKHKPESILDVGCGNGPDMALSIVNFPSAKIVGFDRDKTNIEFIHSHVSKDAFVGELELVLPTIDKASFDVVITNGVLMYVNPELFHELRRVAKKAVILSEKDPDRRILDVIKSFNPIITKVSAETRETWGDDSYIYEIPL